MEKIKFFTIRRGFETNSSSGHSFSIKKDRQPNDLSVYTKENPLKIECGASVGGVGEFFHTDPHLLISYFVESTITFGTKLEAITVCDKVRRYLNELDIPFEFVNTIEDFVNGYMDIEESVCDGSVSYEDILESVDTFKDFLTFGELYYWSNGS